MRADEPAIKKAGISDSLAHAVRAAMESTPVPAPYCPFCQRCTCTNPNYFCGVCLVFVLGTDNYMKHLHGKQHTKKMALLLKNAVKQTDLFCPTCLVDFTGEKPSIQHFSSDKHRERVALAAQLGYCYWFTRAKSILNIVPCNLPSQFLPIDKVNLNNNVAPSAHQISL